MRGITDRMKRYQRERLFALVLILVFLILMFLGITKAIAHAKQEKSQEVAAQIRHKKDEEKKKKEKELKKETEKKEKARMESMKVNLDIPVGSDSASNEKTVFLTFDDGPSANTEKVLQILDKYDAKATFFVTGLNPDYYNVIAETYKKGHTIGLHTFSHRYSELYASVEAYFKDLDQISGLVKEQIGFVPCFIRFPGGSSNSISSNYSKGIMTILADEVQKRGYQYYDWNAISGDADHDNVPKDTIIANGIGCEYTNIILLLHDGTGKETTVEALPTIIEHYQKLGYSFKGIDRLTFHAHHRIGN